MVVEEKEDVLLEDPVTWFPSKQSLLERSQEVNNDHKLLLHFYASHFAQSMLAELQKCTEYLPLQIK